MGQGVSLAIGMIMVGQRSPPHDASGEHLLLGLEGEITWKVRGHDEIVTGPMDLVFIGAGQNYEYF
jgi:quercetin dioxygenase-like cupin family protein